MTTLTGKCTEVTIKDVALQSSLCANQLVNLSFPRNRTAFAFSLNVDGQPAPVLLSFFGVRPTHRLTMRIQKIYLAANNNTDEWQATGSCTFSNIYKPTVAQVECSANTTAGNFAAEFVSDGKKPHLHDLAADQ